MARQFNKSDRTLKTIKIEEHVHTWLSLLAEKYGSTLSGSIERLIQEHETDIVSLQKDIDRLKRKHLTSTER